MASYLLKRFLQVLVTLALLTLLIFVLARLSGDPAPLVMPSEATAADYEFFRRQYGLDQPFHLQYLTFLRNVLVGDFGASFRYNVAAIEVVGTALPATLQLAAASLLTAILIGVPLGIVGATTKSPAVKLAIDSYSALGQAAPMFWVGLMLMMAFAVRLPWFPSSGRGTLAHLVLPVVTLAIYVSASVVKLTTANMQEAMRSDFVKMARLMGLPRRLILLKHCLRNASLPIITFLGLQLGALLSGAVVTERVFAWPGLGNVIVEAILNRDYPVIQAAVLVSGLTFMGINLAVDLLYRVFDPRVEAA